ncbi:MAG: methylmalonyl-CoA decarboxylase [Desulfarculus sp.]|nr:methylmalonyl-CoA decarboxylase [Desulfarculus sp.]
MALIKVDVQGQIGTITLDHLAKRNSLSRQMLGELLEAVDDFAAAKLRVVVLRAQPGAKVWSAGLAIDELPQPGRDPLAYYDPLEKLLRSLQRLPAPVLAMIEGGVWGGACELAFVCDLLLGAPSATFAITPAKIGVPYNVSGVLHFINVVGLHIAKELFFTAQPMNAVRAYDLGLLNHLVPAEELEAFTYQMAGQIARNAPLAIAAIKEQLRLLGDSRPMNPEAFERIQGLRRQVYDSQDYQEGTRAFLEKRPPVFQGR